MNHLDEGILHALVDGEIASADLVPIQAHLDACADCRVRLDEARAMAAGSLALVEALGDGAAEASRGAGAAEAGRVSASGLRVGGGRGTRDSGVRWRELAWAASVVFALGLGYAGGREMGASAPRPDTGPLRSALPPEREGRAEGFAVESVAPPPEAPVLPPAAPTQTRAENQASIPAAAPREGAEPPVEVPVAESVPQPKAAVDVADPDVPAAPEVRRDEAARLPLQARGALRMRQPPQTTLRLEELMVTPAVEGDRISFDDAIRLLGGRLRLVEGLSPVRVEGAGTLIRVIYRLNGGLLLLEQWREGDSVAVRLEARPPIEPDSLAALRARIR